MPKKHSSIKEYRKIKVFKVINVPSRLKEEQQKQTYYVGLFNHKTMRKKNTSKNCQNFPTPGKKGLLPHQCLL